MGNFVTCCIPLDIKWSLTATLCTPMYLCSSGTFDRDEYTSHLGGFTEGLPDKSNHQTTHVVACPQQEGVADREVQVNPRTTREKGDNNKSPCYLKYSAYRSSQLRSESFNVYIYMCGGVKNINTG